MTAIENEGGIKKEKYKGERKEFLSVNLSILLSFPLCSVVEH